MSILLKITAALLFSMYWHFQTFRSEYFQSRDSEYVQLTFYDNFGMRLINAIITSHNYPLGNRYQPHQSRTKHNFRSAFDVTVFCMLIV